MNMQEKALSFLDLLDLDEEIIDTRLKSIMLRSNHSNQHLKNATQLLQYKLLVNTQEDIDCDNDDEFNFAVQLLKNASHENIQYVCEIVNIVLTLNRFTLANKSEHLMQQILSNLMLEGDKFNTNETETGKYSKTLIDLQVCVSILNAIISKKETVTLPFLETPLEKILDSTEENLKIYFLNKLVPKFIMGVTDFNILDRIWNYLKEWKGERRKEALKILSGLSDYYLESSFIKGVIKYESGMVLLYDFWDIVLFGITSEDLAARKMSMYLSKRAIDCVISMNISICVQSETETIFSWNKDNSIGIKSMWDNFFVLIDSLEEKQSNIVLPSLKLFETIDIGKCWLDAAFNIGLKHDNTQVRLKCIEYKLNGKISSHSEAYVLLEAFNDINIYDHNIEHELLKSKLKELFEDLPSFLVILKALSAMKWSPVPLFNITQVISKLHIQVSMNISDSLIEILKIPCNNVVIRKAVHKHLAIFMCNCCRNFSWRDIVNIYSIMQLSTLQINPVFLVARDVLLETEEKIECFKHLSEDCSYFPLMWALKSNEEYLSIFSDSINEKTAKLNEAICRQYSIKEKLIKDVTFLLCLLSENDYEMIGCFGTVISLSTIINYMLSLFSSDSSLSIEDAVSLFEKFSEKLKDLDGLEDISLQLYKTAILFLKDKPELDKALLSILTLKMIVKNSLLKSKQNHEIIDLKRFLEIISNIEFEDSQNESVGRWKNIFFEKSCEVIYTMIEVNDRCSCIKEIIIYLKNVLQCGGYSCLKWILKITNKIVNPLLNDGIKFNMVQFIKTAWNEIEELKSNNQYSPCIEEFVELITQDAILKRAMYNNIVMMYCNKIIESGPVKINPLYYLIRILNKKGVESYGHLVYILCDILVYCPVPRKDQRISDFCTLQILMNNQYYGVLKQGMDTYFNYEIRYLAVATLCSIKNTETLYTIAKYITNKVDQTFRNKQRYHGNSQPHKLLLASLQHILIILLKSTGNLDWLFNWCLDTLVKLPHQPSVRICFEWIAALYLYIQKTTLGEDMLQTLQSKNVPLTSQFFIFYWMLKHKISNNTYTEDEYIFVQEFLLSHTMGQLFNVRLNAQYLATVLHNMYQKPSKHDYTISIINKTFEDNRNDKNYIKLEKDYFANHFDIIAHLDPYFIYYLLPRLLEDSHEQINLEFQREIMQHIEKDFVDIVDDFKTEWQTCRKDFDSEQYIGLVLDTPCISKTVDADWMGTIQKKYIPWKNMSDVNFLECEKKPVSSSDLIVVASLIDKLPNLGGMARTCEVFGVTSYVVDSLRHLQDKQFQGLSVSAERWINVEEVRPGAALKEYLMQKKTEGYSVVAAEQTSSSSKLQSFKFPKKTLLLLGHEKEGVPCDLLPIMDHCVEIPQQGYVRSLNVHVTAAIFVWEYARQNVL